MDDGHSLFTAQACPDLSPNPSTYPMAMLFVPDNDLKVQYQQNFDIDDDNGAWDLGCVSSDLLHHNLH